ncbi:MAG: 3-deoxy-7-phosphoheptulonate synthase [Pseudomonadota bacterium]
MNTATPMIEPAEACESGLAEAPRAPDSRPLPGPGYLRERFAPSTVALATIASTRTAIGSILRGADDRLLVIAGPCSIHNPDSAIAYAERLQHAAETVADRCLVVMRAYVEKPRTTIGWKGLVNDPGLDGGCDLARGLTTARELYARISDIGLPIASEALDPLVAPYLADLVSWYAIGARTTESQTHRELASALPAPVGMKNATSGATDIAIDGIQAAGAAHTLIALDAQGRVSQRQAPGNPAPHLVLRGGARPNYGAADVRAAGDALAARGLIERVIVDCSHANSANAEGQRDPENQPKIAKGLAARRAAGERRIAGLMLESHLVAGKQPCTPAARPDQSVTDGCLGMDRTLDLLRDLAAA